MYYSDFKKALEDGVLQLNANSGALKHEGISQKDWTERILSALSAEYADGGIQSQEPLKNITDKNGNVVYTDVANMLTPILRNPLCTGRLRQSPGLHEFHLIQNQEFQGEPERCL